MFLAMFQFILENFGSYRLDLIPSLDFSITHLYFSSPNHGILLSDAKPNFSLLFLNVRISNNLIRLEKGQERLSEEICFFINTKLINNAVVLSISLKKQYVYTK